MTKPDWTTAPPPPRPVEDITSLPSDAVPYADRRRIGPQVFYIPSRNAILKIGPSVKRAEAEAMRFITDHTSVPVPRVLEFYEKDGLGHLFMSKVEGRILADLWSGLSTDNRNFVINQLQGYVSQWQSLQGPFCGALWNSPCLDIFFQHLCLASLGDKKYGPYRSRKDYNRGLVEALRNSRPTGTLGQSEQSLVERITALEDERKIFSHGDLHLGNIIVDDSVTITGVIDWEGAGFSIKERDYTEAMLRARHPEWVRALHCIFPDDVKHHFNVFKELDRTLVQYSGF
jgi:hypothetical protein